MTGKEIKYIIERSGIRTNAFAEKMGISPQSLNSIFLSPDVKSGTIELVAKVLGVPVGGRPARYSRRYNLAGSRTLATQRNDRHLYQTRHPKSRCSQPPRH